MAQGLYVPARVVLAAAAICTTASYVSAQSTTRASVGPGGAESNSASVSPSMSADGRFVVFCSGASTLVPGDTNNRVDVFVRDLTTGQNWRVSVATGGTQGNESSGGGGGDGDTPRISSDGRFVAFASFASNLVANDTNGNSDVFVHDRQTGTTTRISVSSTGTQGSGLSDFPTISGDGRFVAFRSAANDLVPNDTNFAGDIFLHDRQSGSTSRISVGPGGVQASNGSEFPAFSADGQFVAYRSFANNLVVGDTNFLPDVFVYSVAADQSERVSIATDGTQANGYGSRPSISADGRYVVFESDASNLAPGDTNGTADIFRRDRVMASTVRLSVDSAGAQGNNWSSIPAISANGQYVVFQSTATNLVPGDTNSSDDVFIRDIAGGQTQRLSITTAGVQGDFTSIRPAISADGRFVAFQSGATNLVPGDTNFQDDIFVRDRGPITPACPGDVNGDNTVGLADIAVLTMNWTLGVPPAPAAADLDGDGSIGLGDIAVVTMNWGAICR